ncbi:hypothetical protein Tco_0039591 [Tanacetum coccineum]
MLSEVVLMSIRRVPEWAPCAGKGSVSYRDCGRGLPFADKTWIYLSFIHHADPTKMRNETGKADRRGDMCQLLESIRGPYREKSLARFSVCLNKEHFGRENGALSGKLTFVLLSSVTLIPEREGDGHTDSVFGLNLQTRHPAERSSAPPPPVMTVVVAATVVVGTSFAPALRADISSDNFNFRREMDSETLQTDICSLNGIVINDIPFYEILWCGRGANSLKERTRFLWSENGVIDEKLSFEELSIRASSLESQKGGLTDQVLSLETACSVLRAQVSGYKLFKEQIEAVQDEQVKVLSDRVAKLDSGLMGMAVHLDEEFYPRFLTTIAGQRHYIKLRRAGRVLLRFCSYDPFRGGQVSFRCSLALHDLEFNFLSQLESQKDASIFDIMDSLYLEGPSVETPEVIRLQPAYEQLLLPIHQKEDNVIIGETSLSESLIVVHYRVQKVTECALSHRLSISEAKGLLVDPLSSENLIGLEYTLGCNTSSLDDGSILLLHLRN